MQVTVSLDKIHSAKRVLLTAGAVLAFITLFALFGLIFYQLFKPGSQQNNVHFGPPNHHHQHQHQSRAVPGSLRPSLPPSTLKNRKNSSPTPKTSTTTPPPTTSPQSLPQQAQTGPDSLSDWSTFQRLWHAEGEEERAKVLVQNVNLNPNSTWSGKVNKYTIGLKPLSEMVNFTENFDPLNTTFMMDPERLKRIEHYIQKNFFPLYDRHLLELEELTASGPPERFNGAQRWPECAHSILRVRDQGGCGSCWAVAAISVISDRICIASKGRHREGVSAQQLVECCDYCGGCTGAPNSFFPFLFWHQQGLVSDQCFPYTIARDCGYPCPPSEFHHPRGLGNCTLGTHSCADPSHRPKRQRAKYVYKLGSLDEEEVNFFPESLHHRLRRNHSGLFEGTKIRDAVDLLKRELMAHGPVMLCFSVFEGFMHFHDGVYNFDLQPGELHVYDHCVKVIGWGRQRRPNVAGVQRYLLAVNSWSRNWAKDGTFKIDLDRLSHFHSDLFAGMPQL